MSQKCADRHPTHSATDMQAWRPILFYPMHFSAVLSTASYDNLEHNSFAVIDANLNMLKDSGVGSIRIDLGFDP
ncbi:MAG: hypothetical protein JRN20_22285 [Nitrososphaerota archaeon]|nr:hypothetical protein [Nitrososphaerota archaeon]